MTMLELQPAITVTPVQPCPPDRETMGREDMGWKTVGDWSTELLDQLDYGLLIVRRDLTVVHANRAARRRMHLGSAASSLRCSPLWESNDDSARQLNHAVATAVDRALRSTVLLRIADKSIVLAVIPSRQRDAFGQALAMVLLGREQICTQLSLAGFGRLHGLTGAETSVLAELSAGHEPATIAKRLGVAISTVRTHMSATRAKVGVRSMREMLSDIARLPPIPDLGRDGSH
jgi:DNA-binding CsgD family transcriptional regulator